MRYKYFKGTMVVSEERMLSSKEIAFEYNLWLPLEDGSLTPNGKLVTIVIDQFATSHNLKLSEFHYITQYDEKSDAYTFIRVYASQVAKQAMDEFIKILKDGGINLESNKNQVYSANDIQFVYYIEEEHQCEIIDFQEMLHKRKDKKS